MSGSFEINPVNGQFTVEYNSRKVQTTEGTLVCLLPTLNTFTGKTLTFPDPPKDFIYAWHGWQNFTFIVDGTNRYDQTNDAAIVFTRIPQEYEQRQALIAAPEGADFFVGFVKLTRTTAPTHTWSQRTISPIQKEGVWMPWVGSGLIEAERGISRAMHLVIEPDDFGDPDGPKSLYMIAHQSTANATGGAVHTWGDYPASSIFTSNADNEGGSFEVNTTPGLAVWWSTSSPYAKSNGRTVNTNLNPADFTTHQRTGGDPASTTDPTNYLSVYSVDIKGYFGRRS